MGTLPGLPLGAQAGASSTSTFMASVWEVKEGDPAGQAQTFTNAGLLPPSALHPILQVRRQKFS